MNIHQLFDSIDITMIDDFIANGELEDLHLDFKTLNESNMDRDDRKNLAKALSGFANSDGGIIIWGVDARKNPDGIDCATVKTPIPSLALFMSRLNSLTPSLVNPTPDGIIHRPIPSEGDQGFAVTLVPQSDSTPHMAKGGEDRYFKRSGDSLTSDVNSGHQTFHAASNPA